MGFKSGFKELNNLTYFSSSTLSFSVSVYTQFSCDEYLSENSSEGTEDVMFIGTVVWLYV